MISCDKEIPYNNNSFKPKLVVNSFNSTDSLINIKISKSFKLLGSPSDSIEDLPIHVQLFKDSLKVLDEGYQIKGGSLILPIKPQVNSTYKLEANVDGFPPIYTEDKVPQKGIDFSIDRIQRDIINYRIGLTINDITYESNMFIMDVIVGGKETNPNDTILKEYPVKFTSVDRFFNTTIQTFTDGTYLALFDDKLFNGETIKFELLLPIKNVEFPQFEPENIYIRIKSISEELYDYYSGMIQNNHIYGGPLYYEGQLRGNIQGGLGGFYFYNQLIKEGILP